MEGTGGRVKRLSIKKKEIMRGLGRGEMKYRVRVNMAESVGERDNEEGGGGNEGE